jgi:hypothetical protein
MVENSDRSKILFIDIPTREGVYKENIDLASDNMEELISNIANKLNVQYEFVRDLIVSKMIGVNSDEYSERRNNMISGIQSSINISNDKSLITERYMMKNTTLSLDKKNYCIYC